MFNTMRTSIPFNFYLLGYHSLKSQSLNKVAFQVFHSSIDIGTDIAVLLQHLSYLQSLKVSRQQRLVLSLTFVIGSLLFPSPFDVTLLVVCG